MILARCGFRGTVILAAAVLLALAAQPVAAQTGEVDPPTGGDAEPTGEPDRFNRFASKLSPDEPLYILVGWNEGTNAKFQLSFKYRFVNPDPEALPVAAPFFSRIFFGYTQTSLWDLAAESEPFYDTSYRPSLFYRHERLAGWGNGSGWLWGQVGLEHESNGQGGTDSRSLDILYVQPVLELANAIGSAHLTVAPRVWVYLGNLDENPDIAEYRGYGQLRVAVTGRSEWQIAATGRLGTSGKGAVQVDVTYPLDRLLRAGVNTYLHLQYFDGWGESLLSYDQRLPWQVRLGIAVVR
ncbi:MAG TPA: phospholipase A [Methylomirabilota bacterium]|nr:phospholipase A [Methylomirabilota bacterium]